MPSRSMSIGTTPALCAASTRSRASRARAIRPMAPIGWIVPVTFETCVSATRRVFGRKARATSSGSMR